MTSTHRTTGTTGKVFSQYNGYYYDSQSRGARVCNSRWGFVFLSFEREGGAWRVSSKSAYWG